MPQFKTTTHKIMPLGQRLAKQMEEIWNEHHDPDFKRKKRFLKNRQERTEKRSDF